MSAEVAAVSLVFDWAETDYMDWEPSPEEDTFEPMWKHLSDNLAKRGHTEVEIEGPDVTCTVAVTVMLESREDIDQVVRDVNKIIPWKHGSRGELSSEEENA